MLQAKVAAKVAHDERDDDDDEFHDSVENWEDLQPKASKLKRRDVELPVAEADVKLAEMLDNCLKIGDTRKARFFTHKPRTDERGNVASERGKIDSDHMGTIKRKNLTREELRERLLKKYDTLVPELDPKRASVKLVKVLSTKESLEMARAEAKKQLVDQLELNSVSGNQRAHLKGIDSFKFNDGYELPSKRFYSKSFDAFKKSKNGPPALDEEEEEAAADKRPTTAKAPAVEEIDEATRAALLAKKPPTSASSRPPKSVTFVDDARQVDVNETVGEQLSNPYDFFLPDEDDDILTDEDEDEDEEAVAE